ncbi:MAG: hypothetical protein ACOYLQ_10125 [Hyphomicrobiaceae bacterium]
MHRLRLVVLLGAAVSVGGCAEQRPGGGMGLAAPAVGSPAASEAEARMAAGRRSLASRVLAARALEKVTGRKPEPLRLAETR